MTKLSRILIAVAALLLAGLYVLLLWSIRLIAPQYPEGLGMRIHINTIRGNTPNDLDNINNLNHYIGMRRIEASAIPELRILPWLVGALVVGAVLVAVIGRRQLLWGWLMSFAFVAAAGLVDFWKWEYDYGHNLDWDDAIIKVPGMSYQPPLIGTKQLLNFTATSWPAIGGWLAAVALALGVAALVLNFRRRDARRAAPAAEGAVRQPMPAAAHHAALGEAV